MQPLGHKIGGCLCSNVWDTCACRCCLRSPADHLQKRHPGNPPDSSLKGITDLNPLLTSRTPVQSAQEISKHLRKRCYVSMFSGHWAVWSSLKRFALLQKAAPLNLLPKRIKMQFVVANLPWKHTEASSCYLSGKIWHKPPALNSEALFLISFTQVLSPSAERHFPAYEATCPCGQSPHSIPPQSQTADYLISKNELCCNQHCDNLIICQSTEPVIMKCISEFKGKGRRKLKFICWQRKLSN